MTSFQQAVTAWPLRGLSDDDFREIYSIGIRGVEMAPREQWDKLRAMGYIIPTIGGHRSLEDGLNKLENHARIAQELRDSLQVAQRYEIPNLIVFSGNRAGKSDAEGAANTIAGLKLVAKDAEQAGVTLVMELLNSKVDHPDYQCDHTAWGVEVVKAVGSPRVKLLYDIYHMQIMEGDLIRNIRENHEYIGHYHTAGNPGRHDLDDAQEIYYPAVMRAIAETGYSGWVGHEFGPKGEPVAAIRQAFAVCDV